MELIDVRNIFSHRSRLALLVAVILLASVTSLRTAEASAAQAAQAGAPAPATATIGATGATVTTAPALVAPFIGNVAPMPFTSTGDPVPAVGLDGGAYLVKVADATGKQVAVARWDGKTVTMRQNPAGWTIPLIAWTGQRWLKLELGVTMGEHAVVHLTAVDDAAAARDYTYVMAFAGNGAWAAAGAGAVPPTAALLSSAGPTTVATAAAATVSSQLRDYLAFIAAGPGVAFAAKSFQAQGKPDVHYVEITAKPWEGAKDAAGTNNTAQGARLLSVNAATVRCWSEEPVLAAATALSSADPKPDVRVFATVDKQSARPGDTLTYTYYLFNAGTQAPSELSAAFDIPAGSAFVEGSVRGDDASVSYLTTTDRAVKSITWAPTSALEFGQVVMVCFSVTVQ